MISGFEKLGKKAFGNDKEGETKATKAKIDATTIKSLGSLVMQTKNIKVRNFLIAGKSKKISKIQARFLEPFFIPFVCLHT